MHIGFLTSEYPHPQTGNGGGIGTSIKNLAIALIELGHEVSVFVYAQKSTFVIDDNGIKVHTLAYHQSKFATWYFYRKSIERWLNEHIIADGVDVLEVPDWTGATAFMKLKCPVVMKFHGSDTYFCHIEGRKLKLKNRMFEYLAAKNADAYVGVSEFALNLSAKLLRISSRNPRSVIYNGVEVDRFAPNGDLNDKVILYLGTLIRKKGVLEIPAIFNYVVKSNPSAKLMLVGDDSFDIHTGSKSTRQLMEREFSSEVIERVEFMGKVPYEEVLEIINRASVCIFPSYAEAFPVSWLECMACQKALVTSDIGWSKELIMDGKTGFTVHPSDHVKYAEKISKLLVDNQLRDSVGLAARNSITEKFSSQTIAKQTVAYYKSLISC